MVPDDGPRGARGRVHVGEGLAGDGPPAVVLGAAVPAVVRRDRREQLRARVARLGVVVQHDRRRLALLRVVARREGADVGDGRVGEDLVEYLESYLEE